MENIYLLKDKYSDSIHFVKGINKNDATEKFLYHQYIDVDSYSEEKKEKYKNEILKNFEIIPLGDFDSHNICHTNIYINANEDSNNVEIIINNEKN